MAPEPPQVSRLRLRRKRRRQKGRGEVGPVGKPVVLRCQNREGIEVLTVASVVEKEHQDQGLESQNNGGVQEETGRRQRQRRRCLFVSAQENQNKGPDQERARRDPPGQRRHDGGTAANRVPCPGSEREGTLRQEEGLAAGPPGSRDTVDIVDRKLRRRGGSATQTVAVSEKKKTRGRAFLFLLEHHGKRKVDGELFFVNQSKPHALQ
mmetsp:Transcript_23877/g.52806  ORF Transcript_23877/g.52806 Transcript_23877/m.52806 type:complete len:208 (+) Transcript_23877:414-1037(+)